MTLEITLQRIDECRRERSLELDLSELGFTEIPEQVFGLTWLKKLDISADWHHSSKVSVIPDAIGQLTELTHFNCSFNQISDLSVLTQLPQLTMLDCSSNRISDLSPVSQSPSLERFNCSYNPVSDFSAVTKLPRLREFECSGMGIKNLSFVSSLDQLTRLVCSNNLISSLASVAQLQQLTELKCNHNQIHELTPIAGLKQLIQLDCSENQITDISSVVGLASLSQFNCSHNPVSDLSSVSGLSQLRQLNASFLEMSDVSAIYDAIVTDSYTELLLYGNRLKNIPQELLGADPFDDCLNALKHYFRDREKGHSVQQQIKVQFIGNGRVGKSTLAYALEHQQPPTQSFKETHGIVIKEVQYSNAELAQPVTLQFWDFGGQEIYHATHRLFLSPNSLYVLLWAEETDEDDNEVRHLVSYWLEAMHDLAKDSPVILVKNQIDRADNLPLEPEDLRPDVPGYDQIRHSVKISAKQYLGMDDLHRSINDVLAELKDQLSVVFPASWLSVQQALKSMQKQKSIPFADFEALCLEAGVSDARVLANYLHQTGLVFYRKGVFGDQLILDQNWAIDAVYRLFDPNRKRPLVEQMGGRFCGLDTEAFWPHVDVSERKVYLDFMSNCGICYESERDEQSSFAERQFIVPALLPTSTDLKLTWGNYTTNEWILEIEYPFLHRTIIERLIIEIGKRYPCELWRYGLFCTTPHGRQLFLECKRQGSKGLLYVQLSGENLSGLLHQVRQVICEVSPHRRYAEYLTTEEKDRTLLSPITKTLNNS